VQTPSLRARVAFALWVGVIIFVVVPWYRIQDHSHWAGVQWVPFLTPPIRLRDIVANTLLYIPFGYLGVRAIDRRVARVVVMAGLLSLLTEFSQVFSHGRFPSSTDLVCNTLGAWAGALWAVRRARRSS
jgi:glycopeptide antibiotics resistance protein